MASSILQYWRRSCHHCTVFLLLFSFLPIVCVKSVKIIDFARLFVLYNKKAGKRRERTGLSWVGGGLVRRAFTFIFYIFYKKGTNMDSKKVLLIEDNAIAQLAAKRMLTDAGFSVDTANNGTTGLALAKEQSYQMVILDIGLPDISGIEVAKHIRAFEAEHAKQRTQIIALSAQLQAYDWPLYQQAGIDKVLDKPFRNEYARIL